MTKIGPGATPADEVAHATISTPERFAPSHTVTLFTGLQLAPAHYYLIVATPLSNQFLWRSIDPLDTTTQLFPCGSGPTCAVFIPGFPLQQMFALTSDPFAPARTFTPFHFSFGQMAFSVEGRLPNQSPPSAVPEPGVLALALIGLAARVRRRARGRSILNAHE